MKVSKSTKETVSKATKATASKSVKVSVTKAAKPMVSNTDRVLEVLKTGEQLTAKQIMSRFNLANPHATISSLRMKGYAIYLNERKNAKGEVTKKYRLGNPTRQIVAAGIKALAAQGISI